MTSPNLVYVDVRAPDGARDKWWRDGGSYDLGPFSRGPCSGNLYKNSENRLYVYVEIIGERKVTPAYISLTGMDEAPRELLIRWEVEQVHLRLSPLPAITTPWKSPPEAPAR